MHRKKGVDMTNRKQNTRKSQRAENHAAMMEQAMRHPGIREAMQVYEACRKAHDELNASRETTRVLFPSTSTDHANIR